MQKKQKTYCFLLFLSLVVMSSTFAKPLFDPADYEPNNTEAQIEANSMKWFEERVKYVKENIKMLPDDFMQDWSWDKPLTRIEFLVLMTPIRVDSDLRLDERVTGRLSFLDLEGYAYRYARQPYNFMTGDDLVGETLWNRVANNIEKEYSTKISRPITQEIYEKLMNDFCYRPVSNQECRNEIYSFRPDDFINFAEASKASVTQGVPEIIKWQITERKLTSIHNKNIQLYNEEWYSSYIQDMRDIKATNITDNLQPADIPTIKQLSKMMFQSLMHTVVRNEYYKFEIITWDEYDPYWCVAEYCEY